MTRPQAVLRFGAPLLALAVAASPASASPAQVHAKLEQARAPESQLSRSAVVSSQGVRFYRYRQEVGGLPVLGSQVVVTDSRGAGADLLADGSRRLGARQPALVRRAAAGRIAVRSVGGGAVRHASLAVQPSGERAQTVWRVVVRERPDRVWEVLVDARTGAIVRTRSVLRYAADTADLFDPNPIVMKGGRTGLPDSGDADDPDFTYSMKSLSRLDDPNCLHGRWVDARRGNSAVCAANHDFSGITRSSASFEAAMAYFHIDRTQAYIQSLGFTNVNN